MYSKAHNFNFNKILGGVGALLVAVGSLTLFSGSVGIIGIIGLPLVLLAIKNLVYEFKDYTVYTTAVLGFFCGLIGTVIAIIVFAVFNFFSGFIFTHPFVSLFGMLIAFAAWGVMFLFLLGSSVFFKHTFNNLANLAYSNILRKGASLLLIGSALTIVVIGFILLFVAWVLIAIGFFSIRSPNSTPAYEWIPPNHTNRYTRKLSTLL